MASGLQFEGELSGVPAIIEGSGVFETYGTQPIVRIDDGMRRVYVSFNRVVPPIGDSNRNEIEIPVFQRAYPGSVGQGSILFAGPFNEWGHRELVVQIPGRPNPVTYVQGITKITPRYCELKTLVGTDNGPKKQWAMKIGISQVPSAVLRKVLRSQIRDIDNPTEYLKIADFFLQARQYENALSELRFIQQRFPDLKDQIKNDRILIRQSYAQQILREIHLRLDTGQLQLATAFAKVFNKEDLLGETLAEFDDLEQTVIRNQKEVDQTRKAITELLASIKNAKPTESEAIKRLKNELETELNIANRSRLDAFLRMANDVSMPAKQKLSLAAVELAQSLGARCIVVITRRGLMADLVCNCRPVYSDIYAFTNVSQARRTMTLGRGIRPFRIAFSQDPEKTLQTAFNVLKEREGFQSEEKVVVISDVLAGSGKIDAIQIRHLP